ncbi:FtsX-like permease family protein [Streptomyces violaceorubidus]
MTVVKTSMRNFFAHKGRMALSAVAVLLSVAFVCGTLVFTDTMNTTFDKLFAVTSSDVTVAPKDAEAEDTPQNGVPESLPASTLEKIRSVDGVESVEGAVASMNVTVVNADNDNVGATSGAPTIAGNWTKNDLRSMEITSGHAPRGPTETMVDSDTADKHDLKIGDELRTIAQTGDFKAKIVGIASFTVTNPGAAVVYFDTPTAQRELLGGADRFSQFNVTADDGVTDAQLKQNVSGALGDTFKIQTAKEASDEGREDVGEFMDVIKYAMLGFAGIAFLVGIFLIINTFSMLVAQRTREIGLMRAIGSSRRQVNRSVLVEALLLGVVGSVLGVAAGVGIAVGLMKLMSAAGMNLSTDDLTVKTATPVIGLILGVVVTVLAAYLSRPPGRPDLPDGRPARRRHPGRRQGRLDTRPDRPGAHRRRRRRPAHGRLRRQGERRFHDARRGHRALAHRVRRHRPAAGRLRGAGDQRGAAARSSAPWAAWPSATPCATRAAPVPPAPP